MAEQVYLPRPNLLRPWKSNVRSIGSIAQLKGELAIKPPSRAQRSSVQIRSASSLDLSSKFSLLDARSVVIANKRNILLSRLKQEDRAQHVSGLNDLVNYEEKQLKMKQADFRETQSLIGHNFEKSKLKLEEKTSRIKALEHQSQLMTREIETRQAETYFYESENRIKAEKKEQLEECRAFINSIFEFFPSEVIDEERISSFVKSIRVLKHFFITSDKDKEKDKNPLKRLAPVPKQPSKDPETSPSIDRALAEDPKLKASLLRITQNWLSMVERKSNPIKPKVKQEMSKFPHKNDYMTLFESLLARLDDNNANLIQYFQLEVETETAKQFEAMKIQIDSLESSLGTFKKEEAELQRNVLSRLGVAKSLGLEDAEASALLDSEIKGTFVSVQNSYRSRKPNVCFDSTILAEKIASVCSVVCGESPEETDSDLMKKLKKIEHKIFQLIANRKQMSKDQLILFDRVMKKVSRSTKAEELLANVERNRQQFRKKGNKSLDGFYHSKKTRRSVTRIVLSSTAQKLSNRKASVLDQTEKYFAQ